MKAPRYFVWTEKDGDPPYRVQAIADGLEFRFDLKSKEWVLQPNQGELMRKAYLAPDIDMDPATEADVVKVGVTALTEQLVEQAAKGLE